MATLSKRRELINTSRQASNIKLKKQKNKNKTNKQTYTSTA